MLSDPRSLMSVSLRPDNRSQAEKFYAEHKGKPFFGGLVDFMTSGDTVLMILQVFSRVCLCPRLFCVLCPVPGPFSLFVSLCLCACAPVSVSVSVSVPASVPVLIHVTIVHILLRRYHWS